MGLTNEEVQALWQKKRTKGQYEDLLTYVYAETDEAGVDVKETWPTELGGKNATTLYQGFNNAAKKLKMEDSVAIVNRDGHVYILIRERVALIMADANGSNGDSASEPAEVTEVETDATEGTEDLV